MLPLPARVAAPQARRRATAKRAWSSAPDGRLRRYFTFDPTPDERMLGERSERLPSLELLADLPLLPPDAEEINRNIVLLENTLLEFDIDIEIVDVQVGPNHHALRHPALPC